MSVNSDPDPQQSHADPKPERSTAAQAPPSIRWKQVITTAVSLVVLGAAVSGGIWYYVTLEPSLYPVSGHVFLDGKPMTGGAVLSFHQGGWPGGLAAIGDDGSFSFTTNGEPGIYEGEHGITFTLMDGGFVPQSIIPSRYVDPNNPPFKIQVLDDPQLKELRYDLSSDGMGKQDRRRQNREQGGIIAPPGDTDAVPGSEIPESLETTGRTADEDA